MKMFFTLLALIIYSVLFAQQHDTVFLKREVKIQPYPVYHAIFIDTSSKYLALTNFSFNNFDSVTYFDQLKGIKPLNNIKTSLNKFPRRWIALYSLKGKYYLYSPSDYGNHYKFEITDSTTIDYTMEGPEPSRLNSISFPSPTEVLINRTNYWKGNKVNIKLVDTVKGIAVFTFGPNQFSQKSYQFLMVDTTKAYLFPVVVNYCPTDKQLEFKFDKIDFASLIK